MKILYIALGGKGGSDKALVDLLSKLVKYDIDPLVVCGRPDLETGALPTELLPCEYNQFPI